MKLHELKPGMWVSRYGWVKEQLVTAVGRQTVVLAPNASGEREFVSGEQDGWFEVKPKKIPSERIKELVKNYTKDGGDFPGHHLISAIVDYLDEKERESEAR
jgi:hypothetical protein